MSEEIERQASTMAALAALEGVGVATRTSLDLPPDITYERYEAVGAALGGAYKTLTWLLADWINFGERVFHRDQKYAQAAEATGLRPETLMNYASVGRRVPPENRIEGLPFGVHAEVAPLTPRDQKQWLKEAAKKGWRREDLRERLRPRVEQPNARVMPDLEEAARDLVRSARSMGDGYLVARLPFAQLCGALGEEM